MLTDYDNRTSNTYYSPQWTNTTVINLTNLTTEGWVGTVYPAEEQWHLEPYTGYKPDYSNLQIDMMNTGAGA